MIKWGTFGQQIWGTYGQFQKKIGHTLNFILFQSRLKKKQYLSAVYPAFSHSYVDNNFFS
jgi:hypothetical protein